jgi:hypothetical protein
LALDCGSFILQLQYWTDVKRSDFGYIHQFGQITLNYDKYLVDKDLGSSWLTRNYAYYHRLTVSFGDLKSAGPLSGRGGSSPPPGTKYSTNCSTSGALKGKVTFGVVAVLMSYLAVTTKGRDFESSRSKAVTS